MTQLYPEEPWQFSAACGKVDPDLFGELTRQENYASGNHPLAVQRIRNAVAICHGCSVIVQCTAVGSAITDIPFIGVYGGEYVDREEAVRRRAVARKVTTGQKTLHARKPFRERPRSA